VIGTSIGAINCALIAGNEPKNRVTRLRDFWHGTTGNASLFPHWPSSIFGNALTNLTTVTNGIPGFFAPNSHAVWGPRLSLGIERASYYSTDPLQKTLSRLVDFDYLNQKHIRLSVGAVNVRTSEMRYFDSRAIQLDVAHVMASGALPPAFPAIAIEGDYYWDGGICSNTPIEVVLDDVPRHDSLIFSADVWQSTGAEPKTIQQAMARHKDIQFASRSKNHVARQATIHRLRHVVRELAKRISPEDSKDPVVQDLAEYGCHTLMHIVRLQSPCLDGEDHTKDIDFTRVGIESRWKAGHDHARKVLAQKPWQASIDTLAGVVIHEAGEVT
jgi:NTE family protein